MPIAAIPFRSLPGSVKSPASSRVRWEYAYDRNALHAGALVGSHWVAVTEAGHLLVFDRKLAMVKELVTRVRATCLGPATSDDVLAGYEDGLIERISVPGLERTPVTRLPGRVAWIGTSPRSGKLIVVFTTAPKDATKRPTYTVRVVDSGVDTPVRDAGAFLMDGEGQLWLGADHGEWGGTLQRAEPESGKVSDVALPKGFRGGIYGIVQVGSEVWVHGGSSHLGMLEARVARVWPGKPQILYKHGAFQGFKPLDLKRRPTGPIREIVPIGDRVFAFVFGDLFESDRKLRSWKWLARFDLYAAPGRADAVGSYSPVRNVHALDDRIILFTQRDGVVEYSARGVVSHALSGQLPLSPLRATVSTDELVLVGPGRESTVALVGDRWRPASTLLPEVASWCGLEFFRNNDGLLGVIARGGEPYGSYRCADGDEDVVISGVLSNGKFREATRERTSFNPARAFALPDGTTAALGSDSTLWMVDGGTFRRTPDRELDVIENLGPFAGGWLVASRGALHELRFSASRELELKRVGQTGGVLEAVRRSDDEVVMVDEEGVWLLHLPSKTRRAFLSPELRDDRIHALERDGRGRIWALGKRLYLLEPSGAAKPVELPFVSEPARSPWATDRDLAVSGRRIVIPLYDRGLLVVDADSAAAASASPG